MAIGLAFAVGLGASTSAFAAETQPGEETTWHDQYEGGAVVASRGMTEAHDANNLLQVWRGQDNDYIYVAANNRTVQRWRAPDGTYAQSRTTPQVISTAYGFRVYHTGTDGNIYYAGVSLNSNGDISGLGSWRAVPNGVRTNQYSAPAVTAMPGGESVYLAYHGASSGQLYGAYFNGVGDDRYDTGWQRPSTILGARSGVAPAIAYNNSWGRLVLTWAGEDQQVNIATQTYGSSTWSSPRQLPGVLTANSPSIALTDNLGGQIAVTPWENDGTNGGARMASIFRDNTQPVGVRVWPWTSESSGRPFTPGSLQLSADHNTIFMLAILWYSWDVQWKTAGQY